MLYKVTSRYTAKFLAGHYSCKEYFKLLKKDGETFFFLFFERVLFWVLVGSEVFFFNIKHTHTLLSRSSSERIVAPLKLVTAS